jgi:uncharacterized repeat protein (TIGR03803 family)
MFRINVVSVSLLAIGVGTVLGLNTQAGAQPKVATYKLLYAFQGENDGAYPLSNLIDVDGTLYGTAEAGGMSPNCSPNGCGTVFSLNLKTGVFQTVYSFKGGTDGWSPAAGLVNVGGTLYGTTQYGGNSTTCSSDGCGTVFSIDLKTGKEKVVYSFQGGNDGEAPFAGLIYVGGKLYGTTAYGGGPLGAGTVFSIDLATSHETVVHAFQGAPADGYYPIAGLISVGGMLYGTTDGGGTYGAGTVFALNPTNGNESILHAFGDTPTKDGFGPYAGLVYVGGTLFGTTYAGGTRGFGTVFSVDLTSNAEKVVYSFGQKGNGITPEAGLIAVGSKLYGTTYQGGAYGGGIVFSLNPATNAEKLVYSFLGHPVASLLNVGGTLYGTTESGGEPTCACGTLFALKP